MVKEFMPKGIKGFQKGHSVPDEMRKKWSKVRVGVRNLPIGYRHSLETRKKLSESHKGFVPSKVTREKLRQIAIKRWKEGSLKAGMLGKHHSKETREKMSLAHKGSKSYMWKGGISPINKIIRKSVKFKLWRESVFKRDNWTCQKCKTRGGVLHPDHIKPFAKYPELRFELSNGRTLCINCHKKTKTWGRH